MRAQRLRHRRKKSAGFTLVELLTVVVITGILAAIGVMLVRNHMNAAKSNLALAGVQAIRVAEEQHFAQVGQYLSCTDFAAPKYYPMQTPGKVKWAWAQSDHPDWDCWKALAVPPFNDGTLYGYWVHAGLPGAAYPPISTAQDPKFPTPAPDAWYVIQAKGDVDGDGESMFAIAASFNGEIYVENEAE